MCAITKHLEALRAEMGEDRVPLDVASSVAMAAAETIGDEIEFITRSKTGGLHIETKNRGPEDPIFV